MQQPVWGRLHEGKNARASRMACSPSGPVPWSQSPAQAQWLGVGEEQLGKDVGRLAWLVLGEWAKAWGVVER